MKEVDCVHCMGVSKSQFKHIRLPAYSEVTVPRTERRNIGVRLVIEKVGNTYIPT